MKKFKGLVFLILLGCGGGEERSAVEEKKAEVMKIHDAAMERLGEMAQIKSELQTLRETADSLQLTHIDSAIMQLEDAHHRMFDWMHRYNGMYVDTAHADTVLRYLDEQMKEIKIVDEKINNSISNGKKLH